MDFFVDDLSQLCEDLGRSCAENPDLCTRVKAVARWAAGELGTDSKTVFADIKQILQTKSVPDETLLLKFLVPLYLSIGNKNAAKKVLSSHLQGLPPPQKDMAQALLCQRVEEICQTVTVTDQGESQQAGVRRSVDILTALMDNFALGETCMSAKASTALTFLARTQDYLFQLFRQSGLSAVQMNAIMHDCHVTMQALNRLTQCHLASRTVQPAVTTQPAPLSDWTLASLVRTDILIMLEEQMMVDCRCCCAINMVLLLQTFAPTFVPQFVLSTLVGKQQTRVGEDPPLLCTPPWLSQSLPQLSKLNLPSLPPMSSLPLLWGLLSMVDPSILTITITTTLSTTTTTAAQGTEGAWCADGLCLLKKEAASLEKTKKNVGDNGNGGEEVEKEEQGIRTLEEEGGGGEEGEFVVVEALLGVLLRVDKECVSTCSRVQCIKTVTLWTSRVLSCLKERLPAWSTMGLKLRGEGRTLQQLLTFVWTHWTDQLDAVRQNSRIIFENCLKIHTLASQCEDAGTDPFLLSLLHHTLSLDWGTSSKFPALCCLGWVMGASALLLHHPHFPSTLLQQMTDQAGASHASELYEVLINSDKERAGAEGQIYIERGRAREQSDSKRGGARGQSDSERGGARGQSDSERGGARGQSDNDRQVDWLSVWIDPVITQLCSCNKKLKQNIVEYVLPKVMKKNKIVLDYMLSKLSSAEETGAECLGALIVCLRRARAWGLLTETLHTQNSSAPLWTKIRAALSSAEDQVRLDAFALLCENKRTAEPVAQVELDHIYYFISNNLNNQTPAFRQALLAFCKKLFFRINESQQALLRQVKRKQNIPESTAALQSYTAFLSLLEVFLFSQLYPSSAFARRTVSLALLTLLTQQVMGDKEGSGYKPLANITVNHVHTLLERLTDTFEENKQEAFTLLCACTSLHPALLTEDMGLELLASAMTLSVSTRPQDCSTAAYVFRLILHLPFVTHLLVSWEFQHHPEKLIVLPFAGMEVCVAEMGEALKSELECAGTETSQDQELSHLISQMKMIDNSSSSDTDSDISATLRLLRWLLVLVVSQVAVARTSLIVAAANRPIYPTLHCIRYILDGVDFNALKEGEKPAWANFVDCLLQVCRQVAAVVSPVVQNSSPEGNIPEEAVLGPGLKFDLGLMSEVEECRQTVALMPEYLVVCCWRSVKEVSLILGQLCVRVPVTQPSVCQGLLSFQQMEQIGAYFKQQLMESLHRGAFELAYAGFLLMCQTLWKSPWSELQTLPRRWLQEVITAITATSDSSNLCATRRSAGLPFFIQAIVATETASSGRPSFHSAMDQLLKMATTSAPLVSKAASTDAQVHALNILRALFKDTRLGEDVAVYISDGLKAAILGFKSQHWEVRNSATLLLSALMTRIFGVKRSRDETVVSKSNSQTGREFFHKYPDLYPFLLSELQMATQDLGDSGRLHLHPSLYPVLMVLGRLFPSTMENSSTHLNLAAFLPHIIRCSSSAVYKTRMMAARALQPLVGREQLTSVLTSLFTALHSYPPPSCLSAAEENASTAATTTTITAAITSPHSHIHGLLLQVHHLIKLSRDLCGSTLQTLMSVCLAGWQPLTWLFSRQNWCPCTRKVALDITDLILLCSKTILPSLPATDQRSHEAITHCLCHILKLELWASPTPSFTTPNFYSPHLPFLSELLSCVARLALSYLGVGEQEGEKVALRLLELSAYEVHLSVLEWLLDRWATPATQGIPDITLTVADSGERKGGGQGVAMTTTMASRLLTMALQESAHPETVIKIFQLLSLPAVHNCFGDSAAHSSVFEQLLMKLERERRADVKAAQIQFMGSLLPSLYRDLRQDKASSGCGTDAAKGLQLMQEWSRVLSTCSKAEQPEDLQLSCARVLKDFSSLLLADCQGRLGLLVFEFWSCLVTLLQADDLEVKDVMASVTSKLGARDTGGTHPEEALGELVTAMFHFHGNSKMWECMMCALNLMMPKASDVGSSGAERLFDKGELNTYQDSVFLARVISHRKKCCFSSNSTQWDQEQHVDGKSIGYFPPHQMEMSAHDKEEEKHLPNLPHGTASPHIEAKSPPLQLDDSGDLRQSSSSSSPSSLIWTEERGKENLTRMITEALDALERELGTIEASRRFSLECVFLKGAAYCERTVLLIRLALVVCHLQSLPEFQSQAGDRIKGVCGRVKGWVRGEVNRCNSCNFLLGTIADRL